jgi:hypothetical protein
MYICPVCGYEKLSDPPEDFNICDCCGTEFGLDDFEASYEKLRHDWIAEGYHWFDPQSGPPSNWNPIAQLDNLVYSQNAQVSSKTEPLLAMTAT